MTISKILVCLDLSTYDKSCIRRAIELSSRVSGVEKMVFYHNIKYDFVNEIIRFNDTDLHDLKEKIKADIAKKVAKHNPDANLAIEVVVTAKHNTIDGILEMIGQTKCLLFMGLKSDMDGKGIVPIELIRRDRSQSPYYLCTKKKLTKANKIVLTSLERESSQYDGLLTWLIEFGLPLTYLRVDKLPLAYFPYLQKDEKEIEFREVDPAGAAPFGKATDFEVIKGQDVAEATLKYCREEKAKLLVMERNRAVSRPIDRSAIKADIIKVMQISKHIDLLLL